MCATWKSASSTFHTMSVNHHKLNKKSCNFIISYINLWLGHARYWIFFYKKRNWIGVFMVIDLMTGKIRGYFIYLTIAMDKALIILHDMLGLSWNIDWKVWMCRLSLFTISMLVLFNHWPLLGINDTTQVAKEFEPASFY